MCYEFQTNGKQDRHRMDPHKIFQKVQVGIWRVEKEPNKKPCFYADEVMDELLGIDIPMTPKERYIFHREHIHQEDMEMFQDFSDRLYRTRTEIVYRYLHPKDGEMFVRCAGVKDMDVEGYISLVGTHQNISETTRIEREKQAEKERLKREQEEKERLKREAELKAKREKETKERLEREKQEKEKAEQSLAALRKTVMGNKGKGKKKSE